MSLANRTLLYCYISMSTVVFGARVSDVTLPGGTKAYLVAPDGSGKVAAALYVHWYEPESPTSNRGQFLAEAVELADRGMLSLLVETPWSAPDWFPKRDVKRDFENSQTIVENLRRALDYLAKQPRVDPNRVAYVGHDFGAMYGALLAASDPRVKIFAFQAGTSSFSNWFLYNQQKLSPEGKQSVISRLAPLDPVMHLAKVNVPTLLQFGTKDPHVPKEKADELVAAARGAKVLWYESGHELNGQAVTDRKAWLAEKLKLK